MYVGGNVINVIVCYNYKWMVKREWVNNVINKFEY